MEYSVEIAPAAQRQIKKLPDRIQSLIIEAIATLASNPRPIGVKKMANTDNLYRIRVDRYRIVYTIDDRHLLITVIKAQHRRDVYR